MSGRDCWVRLMPVGEGAAYLGLVYKTAGEAHQIQDHSALVPGWIHGSHFCWMKQRRGLATYAIEDLKRKNTNKRTNHWLQNRSWITERRISPVPSKHVAEGRQAGREN